MLIDRRHNDRRSFFDRLSFVPWLTLDRQGTHSREEDRDWFSALGSGTDGDTIIDVRTESSDSVIIWPTDYTVFVSANIVGHIRTRYPLVKLQN